MCEATPTASVGTSPALAWSRAWVGAAAAAIATVAGAGVATAQMNGGSSQFNAGYGSSSNSFNSPINIGTRDENNNQISINGILQTPNGSVFSTNSGFSQSSTSGGVGASGMATAIGNNLNVVVQGSWNRVIVDSTQINNGDISANASLNGQVRLDP